jgi:alkylation response protein AidB-like acyl-CoA dehydrogenase
VSAGPARSFGDPSLAAFRDRLRAWLAEVAPRHRPAVAGGEEELAARRAWEAEVHRGGYSCLAWPRAFGGQGLGPIEEFAFAGECAAAGVPEGLGRVGRLLAGPAFFGHGTPRQQAAFLPPIVAGAAIWPDLLPRETPDAN